MKLIMRETVRQISDGDELLLSEGETFVVRPKPGHLGAGRKDNPAPPRPLAVQYLGFQNIDGRREYLLQAQRGDEERRYRVWIELAAFAKRQALLQEGPDICYQKLLHELTGPGLQGPEGIGVTEADLAAYRESHSSPGRKSFSAPPTTATPPPQGALPGKTR
jgi:hypothetical protein